MNYSELKTPNSELSWSKARGVSSCKVRTVLYYETGSGFGGSTQSLYQLLRVIDRNRVRPIVVALRDGTIMDKIRSLGIPVRVLGGSFQSSLGYLRLMARWLAVEIPRTLRLTRLMQRERVDIVHLNNDIYSTVAGLFAARLLKKPVVCHLRLTREPTRLERWLGRWARVKIALTEEARVFYSRFWPSGRIICVPNGVEIPIATPKSDENSEFGVRSSECVKPIPNSEFRIPNLNAPNSAGLRKVLGIPCEKRVVGLIARCVPGKGYEEFLRAAKIVMEMRKDVAFVIVGNGHGSDAVYEARMHGLAESLQLNGALIWAGWQPDALRVYEAVDIVVQASSTFPEGFSRVVLEAMAQERPVIATDIAGNREAVVHGKTGLLIPPADAKELAVAIMTLLDEPERARQYGLAARRRVQECFSISSHAQAIERLYDEITKG